MLLTKRAPSGCLSVTVREGGGILKWRESKMGGPKNVRVCKGGEGGVRATQNAVCVIFFS